MRTARRNQKSAYDLQIDALAAEALQRKKGSITIAMTKAAPRRRVHDVRAGLSGQSSEIAHRFCCRRLVGRGTNRLSGLS